MSKREIENSIHRPKADVQPQGKTTFLDGVNISRKGAAPKSVNFYYDKKGKPTDKVADAFARVSESADGSKTYAVKIGVAGMGVGRLLDINNVFYQKGDENRVEKTLDRKFYEFKSVSKVVFDLYVKYLQTFNEKYILQAEREMINGQA